MSEYRRESEQNFCSEYQSYDRIANIYEKKEEKSELINTVENNSAERNEDSHSSYEETKKSHNQLENLKGNKLYYINFHEDKKNMKNDISNHFFVDGLQNYSQKKGDNLGLVNESCSRDVIKNIEDKRNENKYNSKEIFKSEQNLFKSSKNLEKKSKINNDSSINEDNVTKENLIDNSFESAHKNQNIFGNSSAKLGFNLDKPDIDLPPLVNTDYKTKTHDNNDLLSLPNSFSIILSPRRKDSFESFFLDKPNLILSFDKKEILDVKPIKLSNFENNNNELENNYEALSGYENYKLPNNNHDRRSDKNLLNKKKNLPNNNNKIFVIIKIKDVFNYQVYKKNYENKYSKNFPLKKETPSLLVFEEIRNNFPEIRSLWDRKNKIYTDEEDFNKIIENGKITKNILKILNKEKDNKKEALKRWQQPDEMCQKYKTLLVQESINSINTYDVFIDNKIEIIDKHNIYEAKKADFNLNLLEQKIYSIIINKKSNFLKIKEIMEEYQDYKDYSSLFEHLTLTLQDVLDIILYKNVNNKYDDELKEKFNDKFNAKFNAKFKTKLIEFLYKIYNNLKDEENTKKDYIAALLLLGYNLKRYLLNIKPRKFRKQKK